MNLEQCNTKKVSVINQKNKDKHFSQPVFGEVNEYLDMEIDREDGFVC